MNKYQLGILSLWILLPGIAYADILLGQSTYDWRYYFIVSGLELMLVTGGYYYRKFEEAAK